jgi:hypothetical protein
MIFETAAPLALKFAGRDDFLKALRALKRPPAETPREPPPQGETPQT